MKKQILIFALGLFTATSVAQTLKQKTVQVGNTSIPMQASAALQMDETTRGFLPPRVTTAERDAIVSPMAGLMVYNKTNKSIEWYDGAAWYSLREYITSAAGNSVYTSNYVGKKADIVEVVSATGKVWMDRNLGANAPATVLNDEPAYGDLFQFGRFADGHQSRTSTTVSGSTNTPAAGKFVLSNLASGDWRATKDDNLWQPTTLTNNPCPTNYRLPLISEFQAEVTAYNITNATNAATSPLHFPASGSRTYTTGLLGNAGANGDYWSNTVVGDKITGFAFTAAGAGTYDYQRGYGLAVRCIKDTYAKSYIGTKSSVVEVASPSGRVWMDRNLGATRAATSKSDAAAYGDLFQWGRAADGHQARNSTISTVKTNTPAPGVFIATVGDWRVDKDDTLWQPETGTNNPCPAGFRVPTIAEFTKEVTDNNITTEETAASSPLKLPSGGLRNTAGTVIDLGTNVAYWTNQITGNQLGAFYINNAATPKLGSYNSDRGVGYAVRCIKE